MILLAVDPGIRGSGVAVFSDNVLFAVAYVKSSAEEGAGPRECADMARAIVAWLDHYLPGKPHVDVLALEVPQTYGGRASKGDANDLMPLHGVQAALAYAFPNAEVRSVVPHGWKGSVKKPKKVSEPYVIESRVRSRLSLVELKRVEWPTAVKLTYDVTDAIGIGLHALGRFAPRRVFPRE